jgi:hypothetical protein
MRVDVAKRAKIPQVCRSVVPASLEGQVDMPSLVKELVCKGAGDMMIEYTYVMRVNSRDKDKKTGVKEETTTYEVFIPTLKSGMRARAILLVTNRNGVPVPPEELEKERIKTGDRLEKEEDKISRAAEPTPQANSESVKGMLPLGMYTNTSITRSVFGIRRGGVTLAVEDFLANCDLTLLSREQKDGREVLIFRFMPKAKAQVSANAMYIAQLTGEIWVDATDHIATRLAGWPRSPIDAKATDSLSTSAEKQPAVYVELMRVREGVWLPRKIQINALTYPTIFDHITSDMTWTYSDYIHFSTEVKDFKMSSPDKP